MKKKCFFTVTLLLALLPVFAQLKVQTLLTENRSEPIGIDMPKPRFSWQLTSDKRKTVQTAYEIKLSSGKKLVWSTGKVVSDQSVHVAYNGDPLQSVTTYQWQVRVWDNKGRSSAWSEPARFQMAMLHQTDWQAKWIEADFTEDSINRPAQYFRKKFSLDKKINSATAIITSHGMYEAEINGKRVGDCYLTPGWTSYNKRLQYQLYDVKDLLGNGDNAIGVAVGNGWYRGFLAWDNNKN